MFHNSRNKALIAEPKPESPGVHARDVVGPVAKFRGTHPNTRIYYWAFHLMKVGVRGGPRRASKYCKSTNVGGPGNTDKLPILCVHKGGYWDMNL